MPAGVTIVDHPLVARHLAVLRDRTTSSPVFRQTLADVSMMLLYDALRDLAVREERIETPLEPTEGRRLADEIVLIAILRAGLGMVEGALRVVPEARVGHLGMYRDEDSLTPVGYYENVPDGAADAEVVVVDPMLATGGSAVNALRRLKVAGARRLRMVCLVAAPEGVKAVHEEHPEVPITCAAVDRQLDERGYIRPGLGDAGDRIFGTQ
jgi:uracil phosphoribosyltransferase